MQFKIQRTLPEEPGGELLSVENEGAGIDTFGIIPLSVFESAAGAERLRLLVTAL